MRFGSQTRSFGEGIYGSEEEFLSVVRDAGEVGLEGIETNWKNVERYFDHPEVFQQKLDDAGLFLIGAHYGCGLAEASTRAPSLSDVNRIATFLSAVGGSFVVCSGHAPKGEPVSKDTWARMAERLQEFGDICMPVGVTVAYHNHWWEPENQGLEHLAALTEPPKVGFAFDTGHHARAGRDPAQAIRKLGNRLQLVHLADYAREAGGVVFRPPLGKGQVDMAAVKEALVTVGFDGWLVLEEETDRESSREQVIGCVEWLRRFCG